jgi:hypothetical protein
LVGLIDYCCESDAQQLERFAAANNTLLPQQAAEQHAAGATVAVVVKAPAQS